MPAITRFFIVCIAVFSCATASAQSVVFDGIDLTEDLIYLDSTQQFSGVSVDRENLIANVFPNTYSFAGDGSGFRNLSQFTQPPLIDEFTWSIVSESGVDSILLSPVSGSGGVVSFTNIPLTFFFPFDGQREAFIEKWGLQTLQQLDTVPEFFPAGQIQVVTEVTVIRIVSRGNGVWTVTTSTFDSLIIPEEALDAVEGGWQGPRRPVTPVTSQEDDFTWRRYGGRLLEDLVPADIVGAWALPFYSDNPASSLPPSNRSSQFFTDKIVFAGDGTAQGGYSGKSFTWTLADDSLTLQEGNDTFRYRLLDEVAGISLFSLRFSSVSDPVGFEIARRGARFQDSGLALAQNLPISLPSYYQSLLNGEPAVVDGTLDCQGVGGVFFTDLGQARQVFGRAEQQGDEFVFAGAFNISPLADININEEEVVFVRDSQSSTRRALRRWRFVSALDDDRAIVLESDERVFFFPGPGTIGPSDFNELFAPRFIVVEPMDLSLCGTAWDILDLDDDGLINSDEDVFGSSYTNPDSDGDGVIDGQDAFPVDSDESVDSDGDGVGDNGDAFPNDPGETSDRDGDGLGDNGELALGTNPDIADSDGDGFADGEEVAEGSDPTDANDTPLPTGLNLILIKSAIDAAN